VGLSIDLVALELTIVVDGRPLLKSINHRFEAGTITLILGRSGSGKTMLLEALSGLREIHGEVYIGDSPLWKGSGSSKRLQRQSMLQLGTGFQHPEQQLFARTIEEEYAYSLRPYRLSSVQREQRIKDTAFLNTVESVDWLKKDPFKLSGGQKRLLTLAVVEATAPEWLLLDEPTSGIDVTGSAHLNQQLKQRKASGKGTIVVTHDMESLIEAADHLILMEEGQIVWSGTPVELFEQPHILEAAGLALPLQMQTQQMLQQAGFSLPSGWPDAQSTAEAIALQLLKPKDRQKPIKSSEVYDIPTIEKAPITEKPMSRLKSFDPRAIWLTYILVSSGILMQTNWFGWMSSAFVALGVIIFTEVPFRQWFKPAVGLIIFAWIAALFSGFSLTPHIHFMLGTAGATFFYFSRLMLIMLTGFALLSGINHLDLKRALEQGLKGLRFLRLPIEQFALTAALMIRFLPLLMYEWERFSRIAAARGKYAVRPGRIPIRGLRITVIPYLMSLIRLGELLSLILIIRGIGLAGRKETRASRLSFHKKDYNLLLIAVLILIGLIIVSKIS
jgi:energy-coupling factor transport system permease/ATP-binding protein